MASLLYDMTTLWPSLHVGDHIVPNGTLGFCHRIANDPIHHDGVLQIPLMRLIGAVGLLLGIIIVRCRQRVLSNVDSYTMIGGAHETQKHMRALGDAVMRRPSNVVPSSLSFNSHDSNNDTNDMKQSLLGYDDSIEEKKNSSCLPPSDNTPSGLIARTEESAEHMAKTWADNAHYFNVHRWALNWTIVWSAFWLLYTLGNPKNRLANYPELSGLFTALVFASSTFLESAVSCLLLFGSQPRVRFWRTSLLICIPISISQFVMDVYYYKQTISIHEEEEWEWEYVMYEGIWNALLATLALIVIIYTLCRGVNTDNWCSCCRSSINMSSSMLASSSSSIGGDNPHIPARFGYAISGRRKKAFLWWFPFIFIEYAALGISVTLRSLGFEWGQCVYDSSFTLYYFGFPFVLYRALLEDARQWSMSMELLITKLNFIYASSHEGEKMKDVLSETHHALSDMANNTMANWRIHPSELRNRRPLPGATNSARPIGLATFKGFTVVCKTLPFSALEGSGEQWQLSFENEARIQMALYRAKGGSHRVVRIYGICFDPPEMKIVVEYCSSGDLARKIGECRQGLHPMPFKEAISLAIEIGTGMRYIHSRDVLHLDIKPANIGLNSSGAVKILDFGTALNARRAPTPAGVPTRDSSLLVAANPNPRKASGTPGYCSPEQFRGDDTLTGASDIFSYALTIWELLTWHHPFVIKRDLSRASPAQSTYEHNQPLFPSRPTDDSAPRAVGLPLQEPLSLAPLKNKASINGRRRSHDDSPSGESEHKSLRASGSSQSRQSSGRGTGLALTLFPSSASFGAGSTARHSHTHDPNINSTDNSIIGSSSLAATAPSQLVVIPVRASYAADGSNDGILPAAAQGMADARYVPPVIGDSRASVPVITRAPSLPVGPLTASLPTTASSSPVPRIIESHHSCDSSKGIEYYVVEGLRPPMPEAWPHKLRELIALCWSQEPLHRPNWSHILSTLTQIRDEVSATEQAPSTECRVPNARDTPAQQGVRPLIVKEIPMCQNDCKRYARWLCLECDLRICEPCRAGPIHMKQGVHHVRPLQVRTADNPLPTSPTATPATSAVVITVTPSTPLLNQHHSST